MKKKTQKLKNHKKIQKYKKNCFQNGVCLDHRVIHSKKKKCKCIEMRALN